MGSQFWKWGCLATVYIPTSTSIEEITIKTHNANCYISYGKKKKGTQGPLTNHKYSHGPACVYTCTSMGCMERPWYIGFSQSSHDICRPGSCFVPVAWWFHQEVIRWCFLIYIMWCMCDGGTGCPCLCMLLYAVLVFQWIVADSLCKHGWIGVWNVAFHLSSLSLSLSLSLSSNGWIFRNKSRSNWKVSWPPNSLSFSFIHCVCCWSSITLVAVYTEASFTLMFKVKYYPLDPVPHSGCR